jgi:hypothetical protein
MSEWKTIDTAPIDGSVFLAYYKLEGLSESWQRVRQVFWSASIEDFVFSGRAVRSYSEKPTHWMPLPEPPL